MKWVFLVRWKTLQSLEISQVSHKERSWLSTTQLNLLAILKDIYFNTIFIWIRIVELAILTCIFLSEACFLSTCRITTLISWCDFFWEHRRKSYTKERVVTFGYFTKNSTSYLGWFIPHNTIGRLPPYNQTLTRSSFQSQVWDIVSNNLLSLKILCYSFMLLLPKQRVRKHLKRTGSSKLKTKGPISKTLVWAGCLELKHH